MSRRKSVDWSAVHEAWKSGEYDLGRAKRSYDVAKELGLVPVAYDHEIAAEAWWRDIKDNLFKRDTGTTTLGICVQTGLWLPVEECDWKTLNRDWNRLANHGEAVKQKLAKKAAYMEARFGRSPERLPDLVYGDETDEDDYR